MHENSACLFLIARRHQAPRLSACSEPVAFIIWSGGFLVADEQETWRTLFESGTKKVCHEIGLREFST